MYTTGVLKRFKSSPKLLIYITFQNKWHRVSSSDLQKEHSEHSMYEETIVYEQEEILSKTISGACQ